MKTKLEVCIDSANGIEACLTGKADRIELCSSLHLGGLTPSIELMRLAANCTLPVHAMIRPKGGDFHFSYLDMLQMLADIDSARLAGLEGVVLGVTMKNGRIDEKALKILSDRASGMGKTLHRVVDSISNPVDAIEIAIGLGFDCILSSGGAEIAINGLRVLNKMQDKADGRIEIMPGSGINASNVEEIISNFKPNWVHSSCSSQFQNREELNELEFEKNLTSFIDSKKIISLKNAIN